MQLDYFLIEVEQWDDWGLLYYFTHWDVVLCNTFITASSGILLLTTINFYQHHFHPTLPDHNHRLLRVILIIISSFLLLLPRFMEFTILEVRGDIIRSVRTELKTNLQDCNGVSLNSSSCVCSDYGQLICKNNLNFLTIPGCFYQAQAQDNIVNTFPWITYVVSIEVGLKVVPALVLAVLNWKMLKM